MTNKGVRVLGIDPGTIKTGYGLICYDESRRGMSSLGFGRIVLKEKLSLSERYKILFSEIKEIIFEMKPDVVSLESQFVKINVQSALKLGMAKGIILLAASLADIPVFEYAPTAAKRAVVGKGHAAKQQVQFMISRILSLPDFADGDREDEADAFALAICHIHSASRDQLLKRRACSV